MYLDELDRSMECYCVMVYWVGGDRGVCATTSVVDLIEAVRPHAFARV